MIKELNPKLCFYSPPYPRVKSYFDMIDVASEYNMKAVEMINFFEFENPDKEMAKKIRAYADEKNIKIACMSLFINLADEDEEGTYQRLKDYADIALILGSPYLHHTIINEFRTPDDIIPYEEELFKKGIAMVRKSYDYAKSIGIQTIYEEQGFVFNGIKNFRRFLDEVDRDVKVVADFGNVYESVNDIEEFIEEFSDKIVHVHFKDLVYTKENETGKAYKTLRGLYMNEVKIGTGIIDFKKCIDLLKKNNYNGYYTIEYGVSDDESKDMDEVLEYLNSLL